MRRYIVLAFLIVTAHFATARDALSQDGEPVAYRVGSESVFLEGCYPPCRCLLRIRPGLLGTFDLVPRGRNEEGFEIFDVASVDLSIPATESAPRIRVRGSGSYRLRRDRERVHQLTLELGVDDRELALFDSGLVEMTEAFPSIVLSISVNGMVCFDTVFEIEARPASRVEFVRGDCNGDGQHDISDAVFALGALFLGEEPSSCRDACDGNGDAAFDIADAVFVLSFLFSAGERPPPPFPDCGGATAAELGCEAYDACA